jgi:hypothetical protein
MTLGLAERATASVTPALQPPLGGAALVPNHSLQGLNLEITRSEYPLV